MPKSNDVPSMLISVCRSDAFRLEALDGIQVLGADAILRNEPLSKIGDAGRKELIETVRSGKHVELMVPATTYRQKDGNPNLNFLRFKTSKLSDIAASFVKVPMLVDHRTSMQAARIGTIESSESVDGAHGWANFQQTFHVVKPDAVVSVLDGTIDRFSIGWRGLGAVVCTAHGVDVLGKDSCFWREDCYPGKRVALDDGHVIAEYEFANAVGKETSSVNSPAVGGTRIEEIRAALAEELHIPSPTRSNRTMKFPKLAAVLGIAALTEEDDARAAGIVEDLAAAKEERDTLSTQLTAETAAHVVTKEKLAKANGEGADSLIEKAYSDGKLKRERDAAGKALPSKREARLRRIATEGGLGELRAELEDMPKLFPAGTVVLDGSIPEPKRETGTLTVALSSAARQLGISEAELAANAEEIRNSPRKQLTIVPVPAAKEG